MVQDCETGDDAAPRNDLLEILSRAYPRSAPGVLTALAAKGAELELAGSTQERGCGLEVWVPGAGEPEVDASGISNIKVTEVSGGWIVTGCAEGDYTLSTTR